MWELIQIYMGNAQVIDFNLTLQDCLRMAAEQMYIADGMATFTCEVTL